MRYKCNACADTENFNAPCMLEVHEALGEPPMEYCPVNGEEADWEICEEPPQRPKYPTDCKKKSICETIKVGIDGLEACARSIGRCPYDLIGENQ